MLEAPLVEMEGGEALVAEAAVPVLQQLLTKQRRVEVAMAL
jgi:hypothetical protein